MLQGKLLLLLRKINMILP